MTNFIQNLSSHKQSKQPSIKKNQYTQEMIEDVTLKSKSVKKNKLQIDVKSLSHNLEIEKKINKNLQKCII